LLDADLAALWSDDEELDEVGVDLAQAPEAVSDEAEVDEPSDLARVLALVSAGRMGDGMQAAGELAGEHRAREGLGDGDDSHTTELGLGWQLAEGLQRAQLALSEDETEEAREHAQHAAAVARQLQEAGLMGDDEASGLISAAEGWERRAAEAESEASGGGQQSRGERYGLWTTGLSGGGAVTSVEMPRSGSWAGRDLLDHHSDRSYSWAANNMRNHLNQDLQAYDVTFEKLDANGVPIAGTAQGLPLQTPSDMKVVDIQKSYQGSGGYGMFIVLEDVETGKRIQVSHLDSVGDFAKGQVLSGGTNFGSQGASGRGRHDFATHVDVVGTLEAVELFVHSNQSGEFRTSGE